jgi:uncharacterized membrane protein SirB2
MDYELLKTLHQTAATLSITGFALRGIGIARGQAWVRGRLARSLPHVVDTLLLASALAMLHLLQMNPFTTPWLLAKLFGLLTYIGLGSLLIRPGRPLRLRLLAGGAALLCAAYIVSVAFSKNPAIWLQALGLTA